MKRLAPALLMVLVPAAAYAAYCRVSTTAPPIDNRAACSFYVAASGGSDSNAGTAAAPFATIAKLQATVAASANKVACLKAGTYSLSGRGQIALGAADAGETWETDPASPVNSAVLDGGSVVNFFSINGTSNITINAIKMQNAIDNGVNTPSNNARNDHITIENCDIGNNTTSGPTGGFSEMIVLGNTTNALISRNYVHDVASQGISLFAYFATDSVDGSVIDRNVVINAVRAIDDGGAIYINMRNSFTGGGHVTISNNYVRDYGNVGVTGRCIYLDDDSSNVTVTGNICGPPRGSPPAGNASAAILNGGASNTFSNNIFDQGLAYSGNNGGVAIAASGPCGTGGTIGCAGPPSPNVFTKNLNVMRFSGSYIANPFGNGVVAYSENPAESSAWMSISNNLYHNYGGGQEITTGSTVSDASPIHQDPLCSGALYTIASGSTVFQAPLNFVDVTAARQAGPPGFTIPTNANHSC